jgi:GT2 family glycosyltransferase
MSQRHRIAVIVVNWNSGSLLAECLESLRRQTLVPARIIVVDNASHDGSWSCVPERFPDVTLIRSKKNLGFAAANNLAVREAHDCAWVALLNPDAFATSDWLGQLWQAAHDNPEISFFGSRMLQHYNPDKLDGTGDICHVSGLAWRRDHGASAQEVHRLQGEIFSPCAAAAFYRRDAFLEAEGFDEKFFCYFEDVDLAFRLRLLGHRCLYVPSAVVSHIGSALAGDKSDFAVYHGHRNLVWSYFKNMPPRLFWRYLPQHLLCNLAALVWFSLRGQAGVIFRAKRDALKGLPKILYRRTTVQALGRASAREIERVLTKGLLLPYLKTIAKS